MKKILITVDPGVTKGHGIAIFRDGQLIKACIGDTFAVPYELTDDATFYIEVPVAPGGRAIKGDTNDLIRLSFEAGRFYEWAYINNMHCETVQPVQWKGSVPKEVSFARVWKTLLPPERMRLDIPMPAKMKLAKGKPIGKSYAGDVLDAVGIGLWKLGRMNTRLR